MAFAKTYELSEDLMINKLVDKGLKVMYDLLPCESISKKEDLATLTLIYPFNILDEEMTNKVIDNVTKELERTNGVIRYHGDAYYNNDPYGSSEDRKGEELEWCFGFAFLAHAHKQIGNDEKADHYFNQMVRIHRLNNNQGLPEGYYAKTDVNNDNQILGWGVGMMSDYIIKYKKEELNR